MIRVFARKTKWTPTDDLAFYTRPPLFVRDWNRSEMVMVSATFTWDIETAYALARAWKLHFDNVQVGGPAFGDPGGEFVPGRFVKNGMTFTSRGCPKRCPWCLVPQREGRIRELEIQPGNIVQDNNLLACSRGHIEKVFEMLAGQKRGIQFKGGLDIDYMQPWHIEMFKKIKVAELWVACDNEAGLSRLDKAVDLLSDYLIEKKHCYVLVGKDGETTQRAQARCEAVYRMGFLPYAQLYRDEKASSVRGDWRTFCYFWSKPGLYRKKISSL